MAVRLCPPGDVVRQLVTKAAPYHRVEAAPEGSPGHVRCPRSAALGGQGARRAAGFRRKDSRACAGASPAPVAPGAPDRSDGGVRTFQPSDRRSLVPIAPHGGRPPVSRFPETRDRFPIRASSSSVIDRAGPDTVNGGVTFL